MQVITYTVKQSTTVPMRSVQSVVQRFVRELELQFGTTIEVEVVSIEEAE